MVEKQYSLVKKIISTKNICNLKHKFVYETVKLIF